MIKLTKNLFPFKFLILLVFLLIPINVKAETFYGTDFIANLYDNNNGSLTSVTTATSSNGWTGQVGFIANSSGAAWGFNLKTAIIEGHTYAISMDISTQNASPSDIVFSTYNRIGLGSTLNSAVTSYQNSTNTDLIYTNNVNGLLQFVFKANANGSYLIIPFCTSYSINTEKVYFVSYVLEDLGSSSEISQDTINNSLNNQTNEINNSISNSENNIKDSIKETEDNIKDGIKEGFESCRDSYNILSFTPKTVTSRGITFTINSDGSILIKGKNDGTGNSVVWINNGINLETGVTYYSLKFPMSNIFLTAQNGNIYRTFSSLNVNHNSVPTTGTYKFYLEISKNSTRDFNDIYLFFISFKSFKL